MAVPIEGYSVVVKKERIEPWLEKGAIRIPNNTAVADEHLWCCSFMAESDAEEFIQSLEELDLNASQGPDSDIVLADEFHGSVNPYCEWLVTGKWEKAVIAWKAGTKPKSVTARQGWDPKVGSGLHFQDKRSMDNLEFLRLEDNVEVYLNKETGKEVYIGRTSTPVEALFKTAAETIEKHFVSPGAPALKGAKAVEVAEATAMLEKVTEECPDFWNAHWYLGKGQLALGMHVLAQKSFRRAYELEKDIEAIPRELAGVCLELGDFDEAVSMAEHAVALNPTDAGLLGNLALAHLLAGRLVEAKKSIEAARKLDEEDKINSFLDRVIREVEEGKRSQPRSLQELSSSASRRKKRFWEFWKR